MLLCKGGVNSPTNHNRPSKGPKGVAAGLMTWYNNVLLCQDRRRASRQREHSSMMQVPDEGGARGVCVQEKLGR